MAWGAHAEGQQHPIRLYLVVWGWLFVLSTCSFLVDYLNVQGYLRWFLILLFMVVKAGLIVAVFMHMAWERLALMYAILVPPGAVLMFVAIMAFESDYTHVTRIAYFATAGATTQTAALEPQTAKSEAEKPALESTKTEATLTGSTPASQKAETVAPAPAPSASKSNEAKLYTVRPGDTLWKIAEAVYGRGHGGKYRLIVEANKPLLSGRGKIHPGQPLRIPPPPT